MSEEPKSSDEAGAAPGRRPRRRLSNGSIAWIAITLLFAALGGLSLLSAPDPDLSERLAKPRFDLQSLADADGIASALASGIVTLSLAVVLSDDGDVMLRGPENADGEVPPLPSLAEALREAEAASDGRLYYAVDMVLSPFTSDTAPSPKGFAEAVISVLRAVGVAERSIISALDWRALLAVQGLAPEIETVYRSIEQDDFDTVQRGRDGASPWLAGFDVDRHDASLLRTIREAGGSVWAPDYRDLRPSELSEAHRLGLRVIVRTVDEPGDMASLIALGVDGIVTTVPERLRKAMRDAGLSPPEPIGPSAQN